MPISHGALQRLKQLSGVAFIENASLAQYTRFGIGGPAAQLCQTSDADAFSRLLGAVSELRLPRVVIGDGTNLIVSDAGFDGIVLRFTGAGLNWNGTSLAVEAGASLQAVVDQSIARGLAGMHTMTGIPGSLGAAVYGNAGAYGHSIQERVKRVVFTGGDGASRFDNRECEFRYRESVFKRQKEWVILRVELQFESGDAAELRRQADEIRAIRDAKYPPSMKCAGSIFKNCMFAELPEAVRGEVPPKLVRDGKVPSAWFLEQAGAKGLRRGGIQVADYHANLIYNAGGGTAAELVEVIQELKHRVRDRFAFDLEEEVQYVGFEQIAAPASADGSYNERGKSIS